MKTKNTTARDEAVAWLRARIEVGAHLYTTVTHVAKSGMSRRIKVLMVVPDEGGRGNHQIWNISGWVAEATNRKKHSNEMSVVVNGCGMDMGFELIYTLGRVMFPDGFCPSSIGIRPHDGKRVNVNIGRGRSAGPMTKAEMEEMVKQGWKFEGGRNGDQSGWDNDGGYALNQRWI